ncbi:hypothetical protein C4K68_21020 [Pokkaliibacter plantistimulans]|uniref:CTP synthase (glutamine hydrolyzing) n=1 Tax=Proteobacteria bacterium 228 TaxID=2083153 RepID=A0A2S5KJW4_9PROT|nr:CTP synthase [Pokkaliibacter plantistimulans]PPC75127.1 hypothetical protein C4K68_21020 [Pokkaliibacter plantistimulans]
MNRIRLALVGDFDPGITAHQGIVKAVELAESALRVAIEAQWLATDSLTDEEPLRAFDAIWCVPGSPYRSMEGALLAIRFAREQGKPFLGTCGGFQHAVIEFARNVLGWQQADHAETAPDAEQLLVTPLSCSLVGVNEQVSLQPGSRLAELYGSDRAEAGYHCRFGLNPDCLDALLAAGMQVAARDSAGEVRALELTDQPFFCMTLFQPERLALQGVLPPPLLGLLQAVGQQRRVA